MKYRALSASLTLPKQELWRLEVHGHTSVCMLLCAHFRQHTHIHLHSRSQQSDGTRCFSCQVVAHLNQPVQWKSPLGFPIEQHYRKDVTETVQTGLQVSVCAE